MHNIVKADDAKIIGDRDVEFDTRCVHEAASKKIGYAEGSVRGGLCVEQLARSLVSCVIGRWPVTGDGDVQTGSSGLVDEGGFAGDQAGCSNVRCDEGQMLASGAVQHIEGVARRGAIRDVDVLRASGDFVAVDDDHALAVVYAAFDDLSVGLTGKNNGCVGAVLQCQAHGTFDAGTAGCVDDHRDLTGGLQLPCQTFDELSVIRCVDVGGDNADDVAAVIHQAASEVVNMIAKGFGCLQDPFPRYLGNRCAFSKCSRHSRARNTGKVSHLLRADKGSFLPLAQNRSPISGVSRTPRHSVGLWGVRAKGKSLVSLQKEDFIAIIRCVIGILGLGRSGPGLCFRLNCTGVQAQCHGRLELEKI